MIITGFDHTNAKIFFGMHFGRVSRIAARIYVGIEDRTASVTLEDYERLSQKAGSPAEMLRILFDLELGEVQILEDVRPQSQGTEITTPKEYRVQIIGSDVWVRGKQDVVAVTSLEVFSNFAPGNVDQLFGVPGMLSPEIGHGDEIPDPARAA